jgi:SAM-dependent methyltransferase
MLEDLYVDQDSVVFLEDEKLRTLVLEIERLLVAGEKSTHVLDIGSQNGSFLSSLTRFKNFQLYGVEPSRKAYEISCRDPRLTVKHGFFAAEDYAANFFDLVNLGDVIEHLEDPIEMIENVKTILSKNGIFVVSTPVSDCLYVRISNSLNRLLGNFFPNAYLTPPHHLRYFDSKNLDKLLFEKGFSKLNGWYSPSDFYYEIGQSQLLLGFRSKPLHRKLNPILVSQIVLFSTAYLLSRVLGVFTKKDFSYTAVYRVKAK